MVQINGLLLFFGILLNGWTALVMSLDRSDPCDVCYCDGSAAGIEFANCSEVGMDKIDLNYLPSSLLTLDLSHNNIENFPSSVLLALSSLKTLVMKNNVISSLCEVTLPEGFLPVLKHLNLRGNCVDLSDPKCLKTFSRLTELIIETDQVYDNSFVELPNLLSLELVTQATEIQAWTFQPFNKIQSIVLEMNCSSLPESIFTSAGMAENLISLSLIGPHLVIPDRKLLMGLKHLTSIHLVLDRAVTLPHDLFFEENTDAGGDLHTKNRFFLHKITIEGVERLPSGLFDNMPMLKYLHISDCSFIPSDILNFNRLVKTMIFTYDNLDEVPRALFNSTQRLKFLDLSHNHIRSLQRRDLGGLDNLLHLDLSKNALSSIEVGSFRDVGDTLTHLDLSQNPLCLLPSRVLSGLQSLKELHIDVRCANGVFSDSFQSLDNLEILYLNVADVATVPKTTFQYMELQKVILNGIPVIGIALEDIMSSEIMSSELHILSDVKSSLQELLSLEFSSDSKNYFVVQRESEICGCDQFILLKYDANDRGDSFPKFTGSCVDQHMLQTDVGDIPCQQNLSETTSSQTNPLTITPPMSSVETLPTTTTLAIKSTTATSVITRKPTSTTSKAESTTVTTKPSTLLTSIATNPTTTTIAPSTTTAESTTISISTKPTTTDTQRQSSTTHWTTQSTTPVTTTRQATVPTATKTTTTTSYTTTKPTTSATTNPTTTIKATRKTYMPTTTTTATTTQLSSTDNLWTTTKLTSQTTMSTSVSRNPVKEALYPTINALITTRQRPRPTTSTTPLSTNHITSKKQLVATTAKIETTTRWKKRRREHMQIIYWALPVGGLCLLAVIGILIGCGVWTLKGSKRNRNRMLNGQSGDYQGFSTDDSYVFASPYASPTVIPMSPSNKAAAAKYGHMARQSLVPQASPIAYNYASKISSKQKNYQTPQSRGRITSTPRPGVVSYLPHQSLRY